MWLISRKAQLALIRPIYTRLLINGDALFSNSLQWFCWKYSNR